MRISILAASALLILTVVVRSLPTEDLIAAPASTYQGCCTLSGTPSGFDYKVTYVNGTPGTSQQRSDFESRVAAGTGRWNDQFSARGSGVRINHNSGASFEIRVDMNYTGQPYADSGYIIFGPDWVTSISEAQVVADAQHESGHTLGFGQASAGCSIMSDWDPNSPIYDFTSCDLTNLTTIVGPIRVDADSDGYYSVATGGDDCDDSNSLIHPNAVNTNPYCFSSDPWPTDTDYNCDAVFDHLQKSEVCPASPIVLDIAGNGFDLTNRADGVHFDLDSNGLAERVPWTSIRSDDAWLVLDRNANGTIDDGSELFGNFTPQPISHEPNGFEALRVFDQSSAGGNHDSWIGHQDAVYDRLRLWSDRNHDGISQAAELRLLRAVGVRRLSLDYRELRRRDQWGNWFRFGARVDDGRNRDVGPWAFDVYLGASPPIRRQPSR